MMNNLLQQFLVTECTQYVINLLLSSIDKLEINNESLMERFEFNRFDITIDIGKKMVILEDILDPSQSGVEKILLDEFKEAISNQNVL